MKDQTVFRIVRRRAKLGCAPAYEALIAAMFEDARRFPGYLSAKLIPPEAGDGEYQIIQQFATEKEMDRWSASEERASWMEKLAPVAEGDPEYRMLNGLDAWFAPAAVPVGKAPPRWRMTFLSWMGIYPTVAFLLTFIAPHLEFLPSILRIAVITILVAILMSYVIMPRMTRWFGWWLRR
jgi:antibiotic biosynthesis monooxygenase (ABM) superfamily enzyme